MGIAQQIVLECFDFGFFGCCEEPNRDGKSISWITVVVIIQCGIFILKMRNMMKDVQAMIVHLICWNIIVCCVDFLDWESRWDPRGEFERISGMVGAFKDSFVCSFLVNDLWKSENPVLPDIITN